MRMGKNMAKWTPCARKSQSLNVILLVLMEVPVWPMTEAPIHAVALMDL